MSDCGRKIGIPRICYLANKHFCHPKPMSVELLPSTLKRNIWLCSFNVCVFRGTSDLFVQSLLCAVHGNIVYESCENQKQTRN